MIVMTVTPPAANSRVRIAVEQRLTLLMSSDGMESQASVYTTPASRLANGRRERNGSIKRCRLAGGKKLARLSSNIAQRRHLTGLLNDVDWRMDYCTII